MYDASRENSIGRKGFRHEYTLKNEIKEELVELQDSNRKLGKTVIAKKTSPKNLSVDCRSTVGQLSADTLPTVHRQATDS